MEKVKVFLSDPQILFREGIHFILSGEDDFEVTGETTGNEEAYTSIEANPPHIAVLSMHDSKISGPDITRRIRRSLPSVSVILTMEKDNEEQLFLAMKSGTSACLPKDTDPDFMLDTIRVVAQGSQPILEALMLPGVAAQALTEFNDLAALSEQLDNMLANLSPKESELLTGLAAGEGMEQITAKLGMNEETMRRHLKAILNKLIGNDHARALLEAAQRSLPNIIRGVGKDGAGQYVTKTEFNEFKDSLTERLKSFIGELA